MTSRGRIRREGEAVGREGRRPARPWCSRLLPVLLACLAPACGGERAPEPPPEVVEPAEPPRTDHVLDAVWSPDGERLAVTWDRGAGVRLYGLLAGTDSTPAEAGRGLPLSQGGGAWASWSPDGLWIAYESRGDIHRMRPDGTGDQTLTGHPGPESHPAYGPRGAPMAFVAQRGDAAQPTLWLMESDGSEPRPVPVPVQGAWRAPVWHPSGEALAAEASTAEGVAVYRVDPVRGSAVRLASGGSPAFSPSGDALFFSRGDSIFRIPWGEAGAREEPVLTPGRAPRPAPDGVRLAFLRGNHPGGALYVLNRETGETRRLSAEPPPHP